MTEAKPPFDVIRAAAESPQHPEQRAAVHRRLDALRDSVPFGCTRDRVELLFNWLAAAVAHLMDGAPLPSGQSLDEWIPALDAFDSMTEELTARGFILPAMPSREDPIGAMVARRDFLARIKAHVWAADQVAVDSLLASIAKKQ